MQDVKIEEKKNHCNFPRTIDFRRQLFHSLIEKKLLFSNNKERLSSRHGRARSTTVGVHLKLLQKKKKSYTDIYVYENSCVSYFTKRWALGERGRNSTNTVSKFQFSLT